AETTPVAQKIMVYRAVEAVLDTADLAVSLAGTDIASGRAAMADARCELHVPLAVVSLGMGLVGEYPGGADLGQVAGELAFQHAILDAAEIHLVMGAEHAEIGAAGIVLVVADAAVAGNAAIHLVRNERAQILVDVGPLAEAITALVMTGHNRDCMQVEVSSLLALHAVMGVDDDQPYDDAGTKCPGFLVIVGNPAVVGGRRHAGHDQAPASDVLVRILLDSSLAAG